MLKTELKTVLPFVNDYRKLYQYRTQNKDMQVMPIYADIETLIPFMFRIPYTGTAANIIAWYLYDTNTNSVDLTSQTSKLTIVFTDTWQYIIWDSTQSINGLDALECKDKFQMVFAFDNQATMTSEWFFLKEASAMIDKLKLEWWNDCDIDPVIYQTGFINRLWIDTYTESDPPTIERQGDDDGYGKLIPSLQRMVQKHKFQLFAPDFILEALCFMQIHPNILLTEFLDIALIEEVKVTPTYGANYAGTCLLEFELPNNEYIKTNCCNNLQLVTPGGGGNSCENVTGLQVTLNSNNGVILYQFNASSGAVSYTINLLDKNGFVLSSSNVTSTSGTVPDDEDAAAVQVITNCSDSSSSGVSTVIPRCDCPTNIQATAENDGSTIAYIFHTNNQDGSVYILTLTDGNNVYSKTLSNLSSNTDTTGTFDGVGDLNDGSNYTLSIQTQCANAECESQINIAPPPPQVTDLAAEGSGYIPQQNVYAKIKVTVTVNIPVSSDTIFVVAVQYYSGGSLQPTINISVTINEGETIGSAESGNFNTLVSDKCISSCDNTAIDLNGFEC